MNGYHTISYETPLQVAIESGVTTFANLLLERGADVHGCAWWSPGKVPPLARAVELQRSDLVELLLDHGANVNDSLSKYNKVSPLAVAVHKKDLE